MTGGIAGNAPIMRGAHSQRCNYNGVMSKNEGTTLNDNTRVLGAMGGSVHPADDGGQAIPALDGGARVMDVPNNGARMMKTIEALRAGDAAIFPTDTVYGIGVAVLHASSPQIIYDLKRREAGKPIAWLVGGPEALDVYGDDVPPQVRSLAHEHWPGALTIVVKASRAVPPPFRSAAGTIGLRMPANETALEIIRAVGPVAASSANVSGGPDPRTASDVAPELLKHVPVVLDGGTLGSGVASTVVNCSQGGLAILRQGGVRIQPWESPPAPTSAS